MDAESRAAAAMAFQTRRHPIAKTFFVLQQGRVVEPALRSPLPQPPPAEFAEPERQELARRRPDLALPMYRALAQRHEHESLALQLTARCLTSLGRPDEAKATWRALATKFPDDRDLAGRPYGIVAAINADERAGLFDRISSARWDLSADQAEYFLAVLDPHRPAPYLERFRLAREVEAAFRPVASIREGEIYPYALGPDRVFYRADGPDRIDGFVANQEWMTALEARLKTTSRIEDSSRQSAAFYGGAMAVLLLVLSSGVVILHRDLSRESRMNRLRSDFVNGVTP